MAPVLRRAALRDLDLLCQHRRNMWVDMGTLPRDAVDPSASAYRAWLRRKLKSGQAVGWVALERGTPVGSGCAWWQPVQPRPLHPASRQAYLMSVWVDPTARGQGIARRITEASITWAQRHDAPWMILHASDAGRPLYEKMGFQPSAEMRLVLS